MKRSMQAVRVQLLIWKRTQLIPWGALALALAINLGVFAFTKKPASGRNVTGGLAAIYAVPVVFSMQAVSQTFPFAAGLGLTRRSFAAASVLIAAAQALVWGVVLFLLSLVEHATGGFGESLTFFGLPGLLTANRGTQLAAFVVPMFFTALVGFFLGTVVKRFGLTGVFAFLAGLVFVGGVAAIVVSWQHQWTPLLDWTGDRSAFAVVVALPAVLAVLLAGGGWGVLRRAVA